MDDETLTDIDKLINPQFMKHFKWMDKIPTVAIPSLSGAALDINSQHSAINQAAAFMTKQTAVLKAASAAASRSSAAEIALGINSQHSAINQAAAFMTKQSAALKAAAFIAKHSITAIDFSMFDNLDTQDIQEEIKKSEEQLDDVDDMASFFQVLNNLHPAIQGVLWGLLVHFFVPIVTNIYANILTPSVQDFLLSNNDTERAQVKTIKRIPLSIEDVDTDGLRFITGDNVRLRSESSTRSDVLDELVLGQIVTVLSKNRNWIEVMYEYEAGDAVSGWVFTRYTAKFVK